MNENMNKKIFVLIIGFLFIGTTFLSSNTTTAIKEKEIISNNEIYEYGIIILDCNSITGIPEEEHVGGLQNIKIVTNGLTQGLIFTIPIWGSAIIIENNNIQINMENFFGVSVSYSCGAGSIVGIGKNIEWKIIE